MQQSSAPIFIGGLMKSGTSLLRKLLSRHSKLFGGLETHWFSDEFAAGFRDGATRRHKWLVEFFDVREEEISALRSLACSSDEFLDRFMSYCTRRAGKTRWIEKTPDNVLYADRIWRQWSDAKLIALRRDPKDIYASWKKNNKLDLETFVTHVCTVETAVNEVVIEKSNQFFEVEYESLVRRPDECLKTVCKLIDEPYESELAKYDGDDSDFRKVRTVTGAHSATTEALARPIFTSSIGQWPEILTAIEVERIDELISNCAARRRNSVNS